MKRNTQIRTYTHIYMLSHMQRQHLFPFLLSGHWRYVRLMTSSCCWTERFWTPWAPRVNSGKEGRQTQWLRGLDLRAFNEPNMHDACSGDSIWIEITSVIILLFCLFSFLLLQENKYSSVAFWYFYLNPTNSMTLDSRSSTNKKKLRLPLSFSAPSLSVQHFFLRCILICLLQTRHLGATRSHHAHLPRFERHLRPS